MKKVSFLSKKNPVVFLCLTTRDCDCVGWGPEQCNWIERKFGWCLCSGTPFYSSIEVT